MQNLVENTISGKLIMGSVFFWKKLNSVSFPRLCLKHETWVFKPAHKEQ